MPMLRWHAIRVRLILQDFNEGTQFVPSLWGFGAPKTCFAKGRGSLQWLSDAAALLNTAGVHWAL